MERKLAQPTFTDALMLDYGSPKMAAFFAEMQSVVPFDELAASLRDVFADGRVPAGTLVLECGAQVTPTRRGGRPHWPLVLMVKCLLLQKWFGLSDPGLEEMLRDRLSFRRFVGLSLDDDTPDETTFVRFRDRLEKFDRQSALFDAVRQLLEDRGVMLNKGTLVDASVQQVGKGRFSRSSDERADLHTRDKTATHTRMYGRTYLGFKGHIATDVQGFVKDYRFDTAATHESRYFDRLVKDETTAAYADKAYWDYKRIDELKQRNVFPGIGLRRTRGQDELTREQKAHNKKVNRVRFVVEHPFAWMKNRGWGHAIYRGVRRNGLDFALRLAAWNLQRARDLLLAQRALNPATS
jgi:IS5 family transposase